MTWSEYLSIAAIVISLLSLIYTRRQAVVAERQYADERRRRRIRIDLTEVVRGDELPQSDDIQREGTSGYLEYLVLKFIIDNPSDSPKLLKDILIRFVLRDANSLRHLWTLICEQLDRLHGHEIQFASIADGLPYIGPFAGKIHVRLFDTSTDSLMNLNSPARIEARNTLWLKILLKTTDDWRRELRANGEQIRYLLLRFIFADQVEEVRVNVNNSIGDLSYFGIDQVEKEKFTRFI